MPTTENVVPQKVEKLELHTCQQATRYQGICGDVAEYRVSVPKLSVVLCAPHAKPYLSGESRLQAVKCSNCGEVCKPGFILEGGIGTFCTQTCRDFYHAPSDGSRLMYR